MSDYGRLGELLIKKKLISEEQLKTALMRQKKSNLRLGEELVRSGLVNEKEILTILAESMNLPFIDLRFEEIDQTLVEKIPARFVTHYNFMPLREDKGSLNIAISDPLDLYTIDEIKLLLKQPVNMFLATSTDINDAIKKFYGVGAKTMAAMIEDSQHMEILSQKDDGGNGQLNETDDPSVIKFIDQLIRQAVKERATDIHIEPYEGNMRLRYRIDGILYDVPVPSTIHHFQSAIIIRLKIMADLDIAEKRLPQDGRIKVKVEDDYYDLRISILPTSFGESIEIRILSRKQNLQWEQSKPKMERSSSLEYIPQKELNAIYCICLSVFLSLIIKLRNYNTAHSLR